MKYQLIAAISMLISAQTTYCYGDTREWTDITGELKIQAEYIGQKDGKAILKKTDGTEIEVPFEKLSEADQELIAAKTATARCEYVDVKLAHGHIRIVKPEGFSWRWDRRTESSPRFASETADVEFWSRQDNKLLDSLVDTYRKRETEGSIKLLAHERIEVDGASCLFIKTTAHRSVGLRMLHLVIETPNKTLVGVTAETDEKFAEDLEPMLKAILLSVKLPDEKPREWTDSTGTFKIQAEYDSFSHGDAILRKADGTTIGVPVQKLSLADQQFIDKARFVDDPQFVEQFKVKPAELSELKPVALEAEYTDLCARKKCFARIIKPDEFLSSNDEFITSLSSERYAALVLVSHCFDAKKLEDVVPKARDALKNVHGDGQSFNLFSAENVEIDGMRAVLIRHENRRKTSRHEMYLVIEKPDASLLGFAACTETEEAEPILKAMLLSLKLVK